MCFMRMVRCFIVWRGYDFSQIMGQSSVRLQGKLSLIGSNIDFNKSSKYVFVLNEYLEVFN